MDTKQPLGTLKMMKEYKFILPDGKKPTLSTSFETHQQYMDNVLSQYDLELDDAGRYIITDTEAFKQFADNLPKESE